MGLFRNRQPEQRTLASFDLRSYVPLSPIQPASALANADVYACVRVLADAAASCPLVTYRRLEDGNRRRISNPTAEILRAPSAGTTQSAFIATAMSHLLLQGNSFLGKYRGPDGRVEQLIPVGPERVLVERRHGRIVFTISDDRGHQSEHGLDDVIHVRALSLDGLTGVSPLRMMRHTLELNNATRDASIALFRNSARPSGILKVHAHANADQIDSLKQQWTARHSGELAGGIAVLSGDLDFLPIGMSADDAEYVQARKLSATEIARCFRVPGWMIGASSDDSMTYANVEQQMLSFATYSLRPWLIAIEQALTADRDLFNSSTYCEFLLDGLLRADSATRAAVYEKALNPVTGWLRRDEVRRLENLPPETADDLLAAIPSLNGHQGVAIA